MPEETVVAIYDDIHSAERAIGALLKQGFRREQISLMAGDARGEYSRRLEGGAGWVEAQGPDVETAAGAGIGVALGSLGGLVIGLGALAIPGFGPILAGGPLAAVLSGLVGAAAGGTVGGVVGGLIGALVDRGLSREQAVRYSEGVRRGGTLVLVEAGPGQSDQALAILEHHNPVDLDQRLETWRQEGWRADADLAVDEQEGWRSESPAPGPKNDPGRESELGYDPTQEPWEKDPLEQELVHFHASGEYDYDRYAGQFEQHYQTSLSHLGHDYVYFEPAYRYGYGLGMVRGRRDWAEFEAEARDEWNQNHDGTWEGFKDAIRHAWEVVRGDIRR